MSDLNLEIVEGKGAGKRIPLEGAIEIGRDPDVAIVLDDPLVSRRHARVTPVASGAVAEDLGSSNGTFANGHEMLSPTRLAPGDQLLIGTTVLELRSAAQIAARPSAVIAVPPGLATPARPPDYLAPVAHAGGAAVPAASRPGDSKLYALLDSKTKRKARLAPLALLILVAFAISIYLALR